MPHADPDAHARLAGLQLAEVAAHVDLGHLAQLIEALGHLPYYVWVAPFT